jgi:hypothetical protein
VSLTDLIEDSVSLPDMIAIFLGVLELMKMRRIVLAEDITEGSIFGLDTQFLRGEDPPPDVGASDFSSDFDSDSPADFVSDKEVTADAD